MSTATLVYEIMWHVNESLFTYDRAFNPVPLLAESHAVTDKGLRHTITLRKGVKFHNGKEMTSADVVPSLRRWGRVASIGRGLWKYVESVDAKDPYTVVISLKQPSASLIYGLSEPHAAVYPKESIDAAGEGQLKEFIGTGPYRFVEHKPDRHIKLARFKDYSARAEPPNGFGGKRTAWLDEILFLTVPDTAVRLAGVETGEYHHAMFVKQDSYDRIKALPALEPRIVKPRGWAVAVLNHKAGPMMQKKLRQAVQAALDMEPILAGGFGSRDFYRLDPGLFFPEQPWHSTASSKLYNQHDKDKARRLVKEAGYAGQPIRWVTTREYEFMYKNALVAKQQLEEVGHCRRPAGRRLGHAQPPHREARAVGDLLHRLRVLRRSRQPRGLALHLPGLVVQRGEGAAPRRAAGRDGPQEAQGHRRPHADRVLRGSGQRQARRLLHPRRRPPRPARGLPHRAAAVLLEQLAREVERDERRGRPP